MNSAGRKNILLTGRPREGKSTLVHRLVARLRKAGHAQAGGFYTLEVREGGERVGFDIHTLEGRVGRLARVGLPSRFTLGRYGIDMDEFESVALPALEKAIRQGDLVVIDEIGYMELKSNRFRSLVEEALDSPSPVIAAIMRNSYDFADRIKARADVTLVTVTVENRERLVDEIVGMMPELPRKGS